MRSFHFLLPEYAGAGFTPEFSYSAASPKNAAIATYSFTPHDDAQDGTVGAPWSQALEAHYQYLPEAPASGPQRTRRIQPPKGSTGVTITVKPWKAALARDVLIDDVVLLPAGDDADTLTPDRVEYDDPSRQFPPVNPEPAPGFSVDYRLAELPIHYRATRRSPGDTDSLLVLMPSALSPDRPDRTKQIVSRFSWADMWPRSEVIAVADPVLQMSSALNGAWFIHPELDVVEAIAHLASDLAAERDIPLDRVSFYGSSLGGFGAIGAASVLEGPKAIAEVPQIHFTNWGAAAIREVELDVLHKSIASFQDVHPERVSLPARMLHSGRVPAIRLITNPAEIRRKEQWEFFDWVQACDLPATGPFEMVTTTEVSGHAVLGRESLRRILVP